MYLLNLSSNVEMEAKLVMFMFNFQIKLYTDL